MIIKSPNKNVISIINENGIYKVSRYKKNINAELRNFFGFKENVRFTLDELCETFLNYVKKFNYYDYKRDCILVFMSRKLRDVLNYDIILKDDLKSILNNFLIDDIKENSTVDKEVYDNSSFSNNRSFKSLLNSGIDYTPLYKNSTGGWSINLGNNEKIEDILLHSSYDILNRNFFIKENDLHLKFLRI